MERTTAAGSAVTPAMRAEASAWLARLHGPQRNPRVEAGFRSWLSAHPLHRLAFEQTTESWEAVGAVPAERLSSMVRWDLIGIERHRHMSRVHWALAATILLAVGAMGLWLAAARNSYQTEIGEQRAVVLADGSRIHLNTSTRIRVDFDQHVRRVELQEGEALFEVAKAAARPFEVVAGKRAITALGTSFVVRRDAQRLAVTLVEGKVAVHDLDELGVSAPARARENPEPHQSSRRPDAPIDRGSRDLILSPGDRLTIAAGRSSAIDHPALSRLTAWQRGLVVLDAALLNEAIEEMNRYNRTKIVLVDGTVDEALPRISGAFRVGDPASFARALATTYGLGVKRESGRIMLEGTPRSTY